jgi:hypothetical protein
LDEFIENKSEDKSNGDYVKREEIGVEDDTESHNKSEDPIENCEQELEEECFFPFIQNDFFPVTHNELLAF